MEKQKKVLDASVAMKWFVTEEDTDKAHIQDVDVILVSDFLFIEVLNGLRYKK